MAKKKKKSELGKLASLLAFVFGVIAVVMIFLPVIGIKDSEQTYTGLQTAFGYKESTFLGEAVHLEFSILNLVNYILVAVGVVFTILAILGKGSKFATLIATLTLLVGGVMFFLQAKFCVPNEDLSNIFSFLGANIKDGLTLKVGAIVGGIASIFAGLCNGYKLLK